MRSRENGIPVAFREDQLKVGGLFSKQMEDVLVMYNPDHANDYLRFVIRVQHMGKYAFMHVYNMGGSKNYRNSNVAASGGVIGGLTKIGGFLVVQMLNFRQKNSITPFLQMFLPIV